MPTALIEDHTLNHTSDRAVYTFTWLMGAVGIKMKIVISEDAVIVATQAFETDWVSVPKDTNGVERANLERANLESEVGSPSCLLNKAMEILCRKD